MNHTDKGWHRPAAGVFPEPGYLDTVLCSECTRLRAKWLDGNGALRVMPQPMMPLSVWRSLEQTGRGAAHRNHPAESVKRITERCRQLHPVEGRVVALCHCGHTDMQHAGANDLIGAHCAECPQRGESSWRHPYRAARTRGSDPVLRSPLLVVDEQ